MGFPNRNFRVQTQDTIKFFTLFSPVYFKINFHMLLNLEFLDAPYETANTILNTDLRPRLHGLRIRQLEAPPVLQWSNTGSVQNLFLSGLHIACAIGPSTIPFFHNLVELRILFGIPSGIGWVSITITVHSTLN